MPDYLPRALDHWSAVRGKYCRRIMREGVAMRRASASIRVTHEAKGFFPSQFAFSSAIARGNRMLFSR
jgi:hypothetical protein